MNKIKRNANGISMKCLHAAAGWRINLYTLPEHTVVDSIFTNPTSYDVNFERKFRKKNFYVYQSYLTSELRVPGTPRVRATDGKITVGNSIGKPRATRRPVL